MNVQPGNNRPYSLTSAQDHEELQRLSYEQLVAQAQAGFEELERGEAETLDMTAIKAAARLRFDAPVE